MKRKLYLPVLSIVLIAIIAIVVVVTACASTVTTTATTTTTSPPVTVTVTAPAQNVSQLKEIAGPPPASLDQYFPPKAPAPVFMIEMFNMAGPMEAIGTDLQEQDMANLKGNYQAFKAQYDKVSKMVPEWTSKFPADPVTALGTAIDGGNPAQIGQALGGVGKICADCHLVNQVKVEQKYHWGSFDDVKLTNPLSHQPMAFTDYKTAMAGAFSGIAADLQEGQVDNARNNFQAFKTMFNEYAASGCKTCHVDPATNKEIPRKYYVDADSMALVSQMGQALSANAPDPAVVGNLSGAIGNSICVGCHLVHLPAQTAKDTWEQFSNILK